MGEPDLEVCEGPGSILDYEGKANASPYCTEETMLRVRFITLISARAPRISLLSFLIVSLASSELVCSKTHGDPLGTCDSALADYERLAAPLQLQQDENDSEESPTIVLAPSTDSSVVRDLVAQWCLFLFFLVQGSLIKQLTHKRVPLLEYGSWATKEIKATRRAVDTMPWMCHT